MHKNSGFIFSFHLPHAIFCSLEYNKPTKAWKNAVSLVFYCREKNATYSNYLYIAVTINSYLFNIIKYFVIHTSFVTNKQK